MATSLRTLKVAIIGSGPAACYTAKYVLKEAPARHIRPVIHLIERLPTPFGLIRTGVAPDHPEVKNVQNEFAELIRKKDQTDSGVVKFYGNVNVGEDVSIEELQKYYDAIVLAYGAGGERDLAIPGNNLRNVSSARAFVNWYNGHPEFSQQSWNLDTENVVIIGQGNVAIDVARVLTMPIDALLPTDIAEHAIEALRLSRVRHVTLVGRRGPMQAAFTTKEFREISSVPGVHVTIDQRDLQLDSSSEAELANRIKRRKFELMQKIAGASPPSSSSLKHIYFKFFATPTQFVADKHNVDTVGQVILERTQLHGEPGLQKAIGTGQFETLFAGMVLKSIGYKSLAMPGVPFDEQRSVVPSAAGRVLAPENAPQNDCNFKHPIKGLYVSGWLKRGPSGTIGTNIADAHETAKSLIADADTLGAPYSHEIQPLLRQAEEAVPGVQVVTSSGWTSIDTTELALGKKAGKSRLKLVDIKNLLKTAGL